MSEDTVSVMLAWNDYNGNCTHELDTVSVSFGGEVVLVEMPRWAQGRIVPKDQMVERFGGKWQCEGLKIYGAGIVPIISHKRHVGNIHWDEVRIERRHLGQVLQYLHGVGGIVESAPTKLFDLWKEDYITQEDIQEACK